MQGVCRDCYMCSGSTSSGYIWEKKVKTNLKNLKVLLPTDSHGDQWALHLRVVALVTEVPSVAAVARGCGTCRLLGGRMMSPRTQQTEHPRLAWPVQASPGTRFQGSGVLWGL